MATREEEIRRIESDLRDTKNPEILARYPHLGQDGLRRALERRLQCLSARPALAEEVCSTDARKFYEEYRAGCAAAGAEIEEEWDDQPEESRAGWERVARSARL